MKKIWLCIFFAICGVLRAQQDEVIVSFQGTPSWGSKASTVSMTCPNTLNNGTGAPISSGSLSFQARMAPGCTYQLVVNVVNQSPPGSLPNGAAFMNLVVTVPLGYSAQINGLPTTGYTAVFVPTTAAAQTYSIPISIVPSAADSGLRAGMASSLNPASSLWRVSLGSLINGDYAGDLSFNKTVSTSTLGAMFSATNLACDAISSGVQILYDSTKTQIRQVIAPQVCVDVAWNGSTMDLKCYPPSAAHLAGSFYSFSCDPFVAYHLTWGGSDAGGITVQADYRDIATVNSTGVTSTRSLVSTLTRTGTAPNYTLKAAAWHLLTGSNLVNQTRALTSTTDTTTLSDNNNAVALTTAYTLNTSSNDPVLVPLYTQQKVGTSTPVTTTYVYYTDPTKLGYGFASTVTSQDSGAQSTFFYNTPLGQIGIETEPFKNTNGSLKISNSYSLDPFGTYTRPLGTSKTINQSSVYGDVNTYSSIVPYSSHPKLSVYKNAYGINTSMTASLSSTINTFAEDSGTYSGSTTDDFFINKPYSIYYPDGSRKCYFYLRGSWNGTTFAPSANGGIDAGPCSLIGDVAGGAVTGLQGSLNCPIDPTAIVIDGAPLVNQKSIMNVTVRDAAARVVFSARYIYNSSSWNLLTSTAYTYNLANELTGTQTQTAAQSSPTTPILVASSSFTYSGERLSSSTDQSGITTQFVYDDVDRVKSSTIAGLQTNYAYDAASHVISETVVGTLENIVTTRTYDDAGRLTAESIPGHGTTTYSYDPVNLKTTATFPNGTTRIEQSYFDGRLQSVTGTAVVPTYYDYGVDTDGSIYTVASVGSTTSPRWAKSWTDMAGRDFKSAAPDPHILGQTGGSSTASAIYTTKLYDAVGHLTQVAQTGRAATYYQYDEFSNINRIGVDVDNSGSITTNSSDRITDMSTDIELVNNAFWQVTRTTIYPTAGSSTGVQSSMTQKRLSNFSAGLLDEVITTDADGNQSDRTVTVSGATTTVKVTAPNSLNVYTQVSTNGLLASTTDFDRLSTLFAYDALHRPSTVVDKRGNTTTTYYAAGTALVTSVKDAAGNATTFGYDGMGRRNSVASALGQVVCTDFNLLGEVAHQWGSGTYPVAYSYDSYGQKVGLTSYRSTSAATWSGPSWPTSPPSSGDTTTWAFDNASGLLTTKTDAAGKSQTFTYTQLGQTLTATSARGISSHYAYDANTAELLGVSYDDYMDSRGTVSTPKVSYTYTRLGQLSTVGDIAGTRSCNYAASAPWRLSSVALPAYFNSRTYSPIYETASNQTNGTLNGRAVGFTLGVSASSPELKQQATISGFGQLTGLSTQTNGGAATNFAYAYNADGTLASYSTGLFSVSESYEATRNVLTEVKASWNQTAVTQFDYVSNAIGQRQSVQQGGTAFANYGGNVYRYNIYNNRGEMQTSAMYNGSAPALAGSPTSSAELPGRRYEFRYDDIGNRTSAGETGTSSDDLYSTNNLNQYTTKENTTVRITGTVAAGAKVSAYSSDSQVVPISVNGSSFGGDLVPKVVTGPATGTVTVYGAVTTGGSTHVYSAVKNWSDPGFSQPFTYDADGNLISDAINNYFYDAQNRLVKMSTTASAAALGFANQTLQFTYDYAGRRIEKRVTNAANVTTAIRYLYDGNNLVEEIDGTSLGLLKTYTWSGGLVQMQDILAGKTLLPTCDANGNIAALVNASSGATEAIYEYGAYGELLRAEGTYALSNHFRFSSEYQDDETGLIYYGQRYYAPNWGRFINRDPIGESGGINLYGFCGNDGVNHSDYLGCSWLSKAINKLHDNFLGHSGPLGHALLRFDNSVIKEWNNNPTLRIAVSIVVSIVTYGAASGWAAGELEVSATSWQAAAVGAFSESVAGDAVRGTSFSQALRDGVISGVSAGIGVGVLGAYQGDWEINTVGRALLGGATQSAQGGSFWAGFASSGITAGVGDGWINGIGGDNPFLHTLLAAGLGGTISKATGGSFYYGALNAGAEWAYTEEGGVNGFKKWLQSADPNSGEASTSGGTSKYGVSGFLIQSGEWSCVAASAVNYIDLKTGSWTTESLVENLIQTATGVGPGVWQSGGVPALDATTVLGSFQLPAVWLQQGLPAASVGKLSMASGEPAIVTFDETHRVVLDSVTNTNGAMYYNVINSADGTLQAYTPADFAAHYTQKGPVIAAPSFFSKVPAKFPRGPAGL